MPDDGLFILATGEVAVTAAGEVLQTVDEKCGECGCGTSGPSCCSAANAFGFFPPATGGGFQADMSIDLTAAFTANGWTYQEAIGPARIVAPTVTASVRHVVARTQVVSGVGVTACTNQGDIAELLRLPGGWTSVGLSTFSDEIDKSVSFSGASDIYDSYTQTGVQTINRSFKVTATLNNKKVPASPSGTQLHVDAGFNAAEVVMVVGIRAAPFVAYIVFFSSINSYGTTQACPGHEFVVLIDSTGKCRLESTPAWLPEAGLTGTASVSGFSPGNATIAFDISTQSYPQPGASVNKIAGVRFAGSVALTSTMQWCVEPVEPVEPATAEDCAGVTYEHKGLPLSPPAPMPPAIAQQILDETFVF